MKLRTKITLFFSLCVILFLTVALSYLFVFGGIKKAIPIKEIKETHTIKIGERDVRKLVAATQFVDFVTVLVSGDRKNEYIEYQTYKIESGIDLNGDRNSVRIVNKPIQFDRTVLKNNLSAEAYDSCLAPIRCAYAIKACDIAVKYNLLENAKKNISPTVRDVFGIPDEKDLALAENARTDVKYLPCFFETYGDILNADVKKSLLEFNGNSYEFDFISQGDGFSRDALKIGIKGAGKDTYIRMGYTGRKFEADTFASFRKRLQTENDDVTVFSYFDPLDDGSTKQVLSYATDGYRTAFVLHGGKLYYIDLVASDAQTRENLSSLVLYLAMSIRFDDEKEDISAEYMRYIEEYDSALAFLRNKNYPEFSVSVDNMLRQKENKEAESEDEKMLCNAANYFRHSETEMLPVNNDFDVLLNNCRFLYESHKREGDYTDSERRGLLLKEISDSVKKNRQEVRANMLTYFLQKGSAFGLSKEEEKNYLEELVRTAVTVDRIILESFDTDRERNEFYTRLFKQAASNNNVENIVPESHPDMTFCFVGDTKNDVGGSGKLAEKLEERNGGIPLGNVFVLVFSESDFPVVTSSEESANKILALINDIVNDKKKTLDELSKTVHALVFDNCSVRLFTCLDDDSLFECAVKTVSNMRKFLTQSNTVKGKTVSDFVDFWDWRKMNVYKNGTAFLGFDFSNTPNYKKNKGQKFMKTERASEIRTVGEVLLQLQHAYENDDFHFELALDFVEREMRNYIYDALWRPSLKVSEAEVDKMKRYNFIWSD